MAAKTKTAAKKSSTKVVKGKATAKKVVAKKADDRFVSAKLLDKKLFPKVKDNPRREGTDRFKSLAIVIRRPGITMKEYLKAGGTQLHAKYDVSREYIRLS